MLLTNFWCSGAKTVLQPANLMATHLSNRRHQAILKFRLPMASHSMAVLKPWRLKLDHILPVLCLGILTNSLPWELRALQVVATGTTLLKRDLEWLLRGTVRCLAMVGAFRAALVDMAVVIRCKAAMVALQALVVILLMVKLAITAATRVDASANFDKQYNQ